MNGGGDDSNTPLYSRRRIFFIACRRAYVSVAAAVVCSGQDYFDQSGSLDRRARRPRINKPGDSDRRRTHQGSRPVCGGAIEGSGRAGNRSRKRNGASRNDRLSHAHTASGRYHRRRLRRSVVEGIDSVQGHSRHRRGSHFADERLHGLA